MTVFLVGAHDIARTIEGLADMGVKVVIIDSLPDDSNFKKPLGEPQPFIISNRRDNYVPILPPKVKGHQRPYKYHR